MSGDVSLEKARAKVEASVGAARRRMRLARMAGAAFAGVPWALLLTLFGVLAWRLGGAPVMVAWAGLGAGVAVLLGAVAVAAMRSVPALAAAACVDAYFGLRSRVANAIELSHATGRVLSEFEEAAVRDAARSVAAVNARQAVVFPVMERWPAWGTLACGILFVAFFEPPPAAPETAARRSGISTPNAALTADDVDAWRTELMALQVEAPSPVVDPLVAAVNEILNDLAAGRIDREEALRRLGEVAKELDAVGGRDAEWLAKALAAMGDKLGKAGELAELRKALGEGDAAAAAKALDALAAKGGSLDAATRAALERAAAEARRAAEEERSAGDDVKRLLEKQHTGGGLDAGEKSLLKKRQRDLERLSRNAPSENGRRNLERLQRELDRAAGAGAQGDGAGTSDALRRGAEALRSGAQSEADKRAAEALRQKLDQLREQLRRSGNGSGNGSGQPSGGGRGSDTSKQLERFSLAAGGGKNGARLLVPGDGKSQAGGGGAQGGQPGGGGGQPGGGDGKGPPTFMLGQGQGQGTPNGVLELPGGGQSSSSSSSAAGEGSGAGGSAPGTGHSDDTLGAATRLGGNGVDTRVHGEVGAGPTRSQTILDAAHGGFAREPYRRVYGDYAAHAEEVIEQEKVPPGYRYSVRRYFQLIRPRGAAPPAAASPTPVSPTP